MTAEVAVRDASGQFLEGVSGNPSGRPVGSRSKLVKIKERLEIAVRENISAERITRIVVKMADMAEEGDTKAAALIFNSFLSKGAASEDPEDPQQHRGITIRIENATFAKPTTTIEADFKEIPNG